MDRPLSTNGVADVDEGRIAGPPQSCITSNSNNALRAVNAATLAYGSGRTIYINRLGGNCLGLRELSTILVDAHGGKYCGGDRIRAIETGSIMPGPTGNLGE